MRAPILKALPGACAVAPQHQVLAKELEGMRPFGVQLLHKVNRIPLFSPAEYLLHCIMATHLQGTPG